MKKRSDILLEIENRPTFRFKFNYKRFPLNFFNNLYNDDATNFDRTTLLHNLPVKGLAANEMTERSIPVPLSTFRCCFFVIIFFDFFCRITNEWMLASFHWLMAGVLLYITYCGTCYGVIINLVFPQHCTAGKRTRQPKIQSQQTKLF